MTFWQQQKKHLIFSFIQTIFYHNFVLKNISSLFSKKKKYVPGMVFRAIFNQCLLMFFCFLFCFFSGTNLKLIFYFLDFHWTPLNKITNFQIVSLIMVNLALFWEKFFASPIKLKTSKPNERSYWIFQEKLLEMSDRKSGRSEKSVACNLVAWEFYTLACSLNQ